MTYEERVKALAEEMAKCKTDEERARIAVNQMRSAFKQGWACGVNNEESPENCHWISAAESRGLIPSHSKTDPAKEPFSHDQITCVECGGLGRQHEHSLAQCQNCGGHGFIDAINE